MSTSPVPNSWRISSTMTFGRIDQNSISHLKVSIISILLLNWWQGRLEDCTNCGCNMTLGPPIGRLTFGFSDVFYVSFIKVRLMAHFVVNPQHLRSMLIRFVVWLGCSHWNIQQHGAAPICLDINLANCMFPPCFGVKALLWITST